MVKSLESGTGETHTDETLSQKEVNGLEKRSRMCWAVGMKSALEYNQNWAVIREAWD